MNRWIYVPVIAAQVSVAQVSAQQAVSVPSEAEKALRDRVQQFYQLQMDKKYRAAEAFVAEDTKDLYFAGKKNDLLGFNVQKVELLSENTKAKVTIRTKSTMVLMGAGRLPIEIPSVTLWKIENGQWMWYVDAQAPINTPFGQMRPSPSSATNAPVGLGAFGKIPDLDALQRQVTIDRTSIVLTAEQPVGTATITNSMPGFVDVSKDTGDLRGLSVEIDNTHLGTGQKAVVTVRRVGTVAGASIVKLTIMPLSLEFPITVEIR